MSRSLAIAPAYQHFLLGTESSLYLFNRQGAEQWNVPITGAAWGVNIAGNGRVAVAALSDGTIRWYRLKDGQELLAFFPHNDRKRWVLWTPPGYYDASPGAEQLLGWHVNRGRDAAADFSPCLSSAARLLC
jgi:WD40 repeat protein